MDLKANQFSCVFTAQKKASARKPETFFRASSIHRKPSTKTTARKIAGKVRKLPGDINGRKVSEDTLQVISMKVFICIFVQRAQAKGNKAYREKKISRNKRHGKVRRAYSEGTYKR